MLNKQVSKSLILITLTTVFFTLAIVSLIWLKIHWNDPISAEENALEINLPVINWEKYLNLSKQPE
ncbi:MAG: hypothetical protein AAB802_03385 [Patescibacteria group bacterium]